MSTITGTITTSITIGQNGYTSPLTIATGGIVGVASGYAIYGSTLATVINLGTVESTATHGRGIDLDAGGSIGNSGLVSGGAYGIFVSGAAGTVTNGATIGATGASSAGIWLAEGGSIGNSGLVSGGAVGVYVSGGAGAVTNGGTIAATAAGGIGIQFESGGSVSNNNSAALIEGAVDAIYVHHTGGTVTNAGTIETPGSSGNAILLKGGGSVYNAGSAALILGGRYGILVAGGGGTVTNAGTIEGFGAGSGIVLLESGTIVNSGSAALIFGQHYGVDIKGTGTLTNAGTIAGLVGGAILIGSGSEMTNSGTIAATGTAGADNAIVLEDGGSVANSGGKALIEGPGDGIYATGAAGTVTNAGTIAATGAGGIGVDLAKGGTIIDTGTIAGGKYAVDFGKSGGNLLALGPGYKLVGGIEVAGSKNRLELMSGAAAGTISGLDSTFANFATVTVDAKAHWTLAGSATIGAGVALDNYGSLNGAVTLSSGGYLNNAGGATLGNKGIGVFSDGGTLVDGGRISGKTAVYLGGTGNNLLALDAGYRIAGKLVVKGTSNSLELLSSAAAGVISGLGTKFTDFATVTVDNGARWTLAGNTTIGLGVTLEDKGVLTVERLTNAGSIAGALYVAAGGLLSNAATGIIEQNNADPVYIEGPGVRIVNAGTIEGTHGHGNAIGANGGATILNSGTASLIADTDYAILVGGGAGKLTNQGTIASSGKDAVLFRAGGNVGNSGLIEGGKYGINIGGAAGTVTNAGTIIGTGDGVALFDGGRVSNAAGGYIAGIYIRGAAGKLTNQGTVASSGKDAVLLRAGGSVVNSRLIAGARYGVDIAGAAGTVTNTGTIEGGSGSGIALFDGGRVVNSSLIAGGQYGVNIAGAAGSVTNTGTIIDTGSTGDGIALFDGGRVSNAAGGYIAGYNGGGVAGTLGTLVNAGTIVGTHRQGFSLGAGGRVVNSGLIDGAQIGVYIGGAAGTVTNSGTIEGNLGIDAKNSAGTVTNTGTILGTGGGTGVALFDGGRIVNSGLIEGNPGIEAKNSAGTVTNTGTILGDGSGDGITLLDGGIIGNSALIEGYSGVFIKGGTGTVTNTGTIRGTGAGSTGVALFDRGSIENGGKSALVVGVLDGIQMNYGVHTVTNAGTILGTNGDGVVALSGGGSIVNSGLIEGYAVGVHLESQAGVVTNSGTIEATGAGGSGILLASGGTVVNSGTIEATGAGGGAVIFQGGTDLLVVDPGAAFIGTVIGDGGGSTLELAAAKGEAGTLSGLGTSFQAFGTVEVDPKAVWTLSGDLSGSHLVNDGKIVVSGTQSLVFGTVSQNGAHGTIQLAGGAAEFAAALGKSQSLVFSGTGGVAKLDLPTLFAATISGFAAGDTIDLTDTPVTSLSFSKGVLTISDNGKQAAALSFKGTYTTSEFAFSPDGSAGTLIALGKPVAGAAMPVFVHAAPGPHGGAPVAAGAFTPFASEPPAPAAGASDAGAAPLAWTADPFHFWTIQG